MSALVSVDPLSALTPREAQVAVLVAEGLTNKEIAERLEVHVDTVKATLSRVFAKLGVCNRARVAAALVEAGARVAPGVAPVQRGEIVVLLAQLRRTGLSGKQQELVARLERLVAAGRPL